MQPMQVGAQGMPGVIGQQQPIQQVDIQNMQMKPQQPQVA
jgi:hypothetical protein